MPRPSLAASVDAGFHLETPRTFERNILYDTPDGGSAPKPPSSACAVWRPLDVT